MRRALAVVLAAIPIVVLGAAQPTTGQLIEVDEFNTTAVVSYINAAQCAGTSSLDWLIQPVSSTFNSGVGNITLYASSVQPTVASGATLAFCAVTSSTNPTVTAGPVPNASFSASVQTPQAISGSSIVATAGLNCSTSDENLPLWVCAHWSNDSGDKAGVAVGKFLIQVKAPGVPENVSATPGESALIVDWSAPTTTDVNVDHYKVVLTPQASTDPTAPTDSTTHTVDNVGGTSTRVSHLVNGVEYKIEVASVSIGGNPSALTAGADLVAPIPVDSFWEYYQRRGGQEQGGCGSGPAGALALLGVASLVALRRRKQ